MGEKITGVVRETLVGSNRMGLFIVGFLVIFYFFLPLSIVYVLLAYAVEARRVWVSSTQQQSPLFLSLFSASSLDGKFLKSPPLPA